jgi:hypothetical protein
MKRSWGVAAAAALLVACGGTSVRDGSGGASGSGGSLGGSGGAGAIGGAPLGGSGGSLGGVGGGSGGHPAGAAGAAAAGGGVHTAIEEICDQLSKLPCGMPVGECWYEAQQSVAEAHQLGCGLEYEQFFFCIAEYPLTCGPGGTDPVFHPACGPLFDKFAACAGDGEEVCGVSQGPGTCSISCTHWSAKCAQQGSSLWCLCASGPMAGLELSVAGSCSGPWTQSVEAACAP